MLAENFFGPAIILTMGICCNGDCSNFFSGDRKVIKAMHLVTRRFSLLARVCYNAQAEQIPGIPSRTPFSRRSENLTPPVGQGISIPAITMTIRWYRLAVFALWLAAMSWLTVRKILPPFFTGEPPVYESASGDKPRPPWHGIFT